MHNILRKKVIIVSILLVIILGNTRGIPHLSGIYFEGTNYIGSGWQEREAREIEVSTKPFIANITALSDNRTLTAKNILWEIYDYHGNYHQLWNSTIDFTRGFNDNNILLYNVHVWIEEDIDFRIDVRFYMVSDALTPILTIPNIDSESPSANGMISFSLLILASVVFLVSVFYLKSRRKRIE